MLSSLLSNPHVTGPGRPHELGDVVRHSTYVSRPSNNRHEPLQPPLQLQHRSNRISSSQQHFNSPLRISSHHNDSGRQQDIERRVTTVIHDPRRRPNASSTPSSFRCRPQAAAASLLLPSLHNDLATQWAPAQAPTLHHPTHPRRRHHLHVLVDVLLDDEPLQLPSNAAAVSSASTHHRVMKIAV